MLAVHTQFDHRKRTRVKRVGTEFADGAIDALFLQGYQTGQNWKKPVGYVCASFSSTIYAFRGIFFSKLCFPDLSRVSAGDFVRLCE